VLKELERDAHLLPPDAVLTLLKIVNTRWTPPNRLRSLVRVLEKHPEADAEVVRKAQELIRGQAEDQERLGPLPDPEVSPVGPGDVPGDRQSQSAPPGIP
jgi:hypothetical protein